MFVGMLFLGILVILIAGLICLVHPGEKFGIKIETQAETIAVLGVALVVFGAVIQDVGADKPVQRSPFAPVLQLEALMSKADTDR